MVEKTSKRIVDEDLKSLISSQQATFDAIHKGVKNTDSSNLEAQIALASNSASVPMGHVEEILKKDNLNDRNELTGKFKNFQIKDKIFAFVETKSNKEMIAQIIILNENASKNSDLNDFDCDFLKRLMKRASSNMVQDTIAEKCKDVEDFEISSEDLAQIEKNYSKLNPRGKFNPGVPQMHLKGREFSYGDICKIPFGIPLGYQHYNHDEPTKEDHALFTHCTKTDNFIEACMWKYHMNKFLQTNLIISKNTNALNTIALALCIMKQIQVVPHLRQKDLRKKKTPGMNNAVMAIMKKEFKITK